MQRGACLRSPGPEDVECRFVREFMLLLDGISVQGQSTTFGITVAMCLSARVVARSLRTATASTYTRSFCVASLTTGRAIGQMGGQENNFSSL